MGVYGVSFVRDTEREVSLVFSAETSWVVPAEYFRKTLRRMRVAGRGG
jgi:hypothetical protein